MPVDSGILTALISGTEGNDSLTGSNGDDVIGALAGNDTQGLRYGTAGTKEEFFVTWKGEAEVEASDITMISRRSAG